MEFRIFSTAGSSKTVEGESIIIPENWILVKDKDGDVIHAMNPGAVAIIDYKKIDNTPHIKVVSK